jgi:hypothetical protein
VQAEAEEEIAGISPHSLARLHSALLYLVLGPGSQGAGLFVLRVDLLEHAEAFFEASAWSQVGGQLKFGGMIINYEPPIVTPPRKTAHGFVFRFLSVGGLTNWLESATDLHNPLWTTVTNPVGTGEILSFTPDAATGPQALLSGPRHRLIGIIPADVTAPPVTRRAASSTDSTSRPRGSRPSRSSLPG